MLIRTTLSICSLLLSTSLFAATQAPQNTIDNTYDKRKITQLTQQALTDETLLTNTLTLLQHYPKGLSIENLISELRKSERQPLNSLPLLELQKSATHKCFSKTRSTIQSEQCLLNTNGDIEIPELWLFTPKSKPNRSLNDEILFAYPPSGNETEWTKIEAFDRYGNIVLLDPTREPTVPVIVIETKGAQAFSQKVQLMNQALQHAGIQSMPRTSAKNNISTQSEKATKMTHIRLNDDKEPWIKGDAEIYMITSGVKNSGRDAEIKITELNYLNEDGKSYYPNQLVLFWSDYTYDVANIQLWEDDGDTNYRALLSALITAVGKAGDLSNLPELTAVMEIASLIVSAMPDSWLSDDDDFVDTCYTIKRDAFYNNHYCAAGNAKISLEPFTINAN